MLTYRLEVYGVLWQGSRAACVYPVDAARAAVIRNYGNDEYPYAGDFQAILDFRLVEISRTFKRQEFTERQKTLRGFRNGMTPARFRRIYP
jgi:hypothetical protein